MNKLILGFWCLFLLSCSDGKELESELFVINCFPLDSIPANFPPIDYPKDNLPTKERIALGKKMFYDKNLSADKTVSCASCHFATRSFSDTINVSIGAHGREGRRNASPLHNVAYLPRIFKDGGIPNLELQIKAPIEDHLEMNYNMHELTLRISKDSLYQKWSRLAYDRSIDAFVITRALANFMRTLISGNSNYDKGKLDTTILNASAKRGMKLFYGEQAKCYSCHEGFNFTNNEYMNNGSHIVYKDTGRARITLKSIDHGKFKVPSLRNVALTGPYMHDGSYKDLWAVLDNYQKGGSGQWNQHPNISQITFSNQDKMDLMEFLQNLTDEEFLNNDSYVYSLNL